MAEIPQLVLCVSKWNTETLKTIKRNKHYWEAGYKILFEKSNHQIARTPD